VTAAPLPGERPREIPRDWGSFGITPELIAFVKGEEGLVLHPYRCPGGYPTIGYGHRIPSMEHPPITRAGAEALLASDLRVKRDLLLAISPMLAHERARRVAALVDFCFNCGEGAYKASTLRQRVEVRDWGAARHEILRWVYAAGRVFQPLVERRRETGRWLAEG